MFLLGNIVKGDKTTCGGTVITGSTFTDFDGKYSARIGDKIACGSKNRICTIISGDNTTVIDGAPMAIHGSATDGGCTCVSQNHDKSGIGTESLRQGFEPEGIALADNGEWVVAGKYDDVFLLHSENGAPLAHVNYVIEVDDGTEFYGVTDEEGHTAPLPPQDVQRAVNIYLV